MCPYQEVGCMFRHELSPQCKYKSTCNRKLCQYQHKDAVDENELEKELDSEKSFEMIISYNQGPKCDQCDHLFESDDHLKNHKEIHHIQIKTYPCETNHLTGTEHNLKKVDDYSEDSEDEDYSEKCRFCKRVFTTYETFDNHQDSYLQCDKCKVCFHNEFQWNEHTQCGRYD